MRIMYPPLFALIMRVVVFFYDEDVNTFYLFNGGTFYFIMFNYSDVMWVLLYYIYLYVGCELSSTLNGNMHLLLCILLLICKSIMAS